jgi:uncharacterized protein YneF (UPF0154 family)/predicted Ser/Thr protein kinase
MNCPSCGEEFAASDRFCRACGAPISSISQAPTAAIESPAAAAPMPAPAGRLISSDSLPVGGFTPGMVLAGRYRVIGLIGRGGMGEVYRADDLKLGQPVALKFLPKALADDAVRRERLFAEVRIARQVSHPNICRVYDIGELEGRHFLTMEYIDGEDLASLLKRIGNLHGTKALDVAKQLCAGLAAAHDKGVLHRDLKPANVMIDGRGRVRITDFGLAVAAGEEIPDNDVSGTPPYMAPEQFAGKGASIRSDIYALGLIFYEIFTGRRAFEAKNLAELRSMKETSSPKAPSEIARDIDPIVERVILRCIEKDPRQRPASAAHVASALPGGDPLATAIAAGETPSPEMVAASGSTEGLKPWIAWTCLAFIILASGASVALHQFIVRRLMEMPMGNSPEIMAAKARDILKDIGYSDSSIDYAFGFEPNGDYFNRVRNIDKSSSRFNSAPALAIQFWYRQSPQSLTPGSGQIAIAPTNPPLTTRGESLVWLDYRGNLTGLQVIPPEDAKTAPPGQPPDWSPLFKAAGIDETKCTAADPDPAYLAYDDMTRKAWIGTLPDRPDVKVRIDAAARGSKPVSWRMIAPFRQGDKIASSAPSSSTRAFIVYVILLSTVIFGGAFFARRNLRMGRGDRRGAARLAFFLLVLSLVSWLFEAHHVGGTGGVDLFLINAGRWVLNAALFWLMYIALEPFIRRRWPGMMVGWSRMLGGSFRDSLVGRDLLAGCCVGALLLLAEYLKFLPASWLGTPQPIPYVGNPNMTLALFSVGRIIISTVLNLMYGSIANPLLVGFLLFLVRILLKKTWIAICIGFLFIFLIRAYQPDPDVLIFMLVSTAVWIFVVFRFGLLTLMAALFFYNLASTFPIEMQPAFYSWIGFIGLAILLAFALYAFHTSLGGQPMFGRASIED